MSIQILNKRLTPDKTMLCEGLSIKEFRCKCLHPSCCLVIITDNLRLAYEISRRTFQLPLKINSGHRCAWYNHYLREKGKAKTATLSRHVTGEAIDISKHHIEHLDKEYVRQTFRDSGFSTVIEYENFWHCDVRKELLRAF